MQLVSCDDCGRVIQPHETACLHGERIICAQCDLKHRVGLPQLEFCTRCQGVISVGQTPWVIDGLIVCEPCAEKSPPEPADVPQAQSEVASDVADVESEEDAVMTQLALETAQSLISTWLSRTEPQTSAIASSEPHLT